MQVDAPVWYWTPLGMRTTFSVHGSSTRYIEANDAERLLEEAHERGRQRGLEQAKEYK